MHEAALALAALPAPTVVLGILLRPYSLGHELFLTGLVPSWTPTKLERAVLTCCQSWEENRATNFSLWEQAKVQLWRARTRKLYRPENALAFLGECAAFDGYRQAGSLEFPESDVQRPGATPGRIPGSPFLLRLQQFLMVRFGLSEAGAWDYPMGLAKMRLQAFYEAEGTYGVKNQHEADFDAFCAEEDRKAELEAQGQPAGTPCPEPAKAGTPCPEPGGNDA